MEKMAGIDGIRLKLLLILVAFALVPVICVGIVSLVEMNQASIDVQNNISGLSTSLNRSALTVMPSDADQVQLAIAKARQYDEFFQRIASENELVAGYEGTFSTNESCIPPGIWIAPTGSNQNASGKRDVTIRSLCVPARMMQSLINAEPSLSLTYIGTEDGILVTWPYSSQTIGSTAPFGYKDMPYYSEAKLKKTTIWTGPYVNSKGLHAMTITTPIYRGREFAGIVGMDLSVESIYRDLSSMKGRGYPFIIDGKGLIISRPDDKPDATIKDLFEADNLNEATSPDVRALAKGMLAGSSGSIVVGLGNSDGYVAYSRITSLGWTLGIAYPAEEMSLPARFIDSGIKAVAKSTTQGLDDASRRVREIAFIIIVLTAFSVLAAGFLLSRRIDDELGTLVGMVEKVSRGELDVEAKTSGEMANLGIALNSMVKGLKDHMARLEGDAVLRGGSGMETDFLEGVKRNLVPAGVPEEDGYEIQALYWPSDKNSFDLYDISRAEGGIAFALAGVGGDGIQAAMLAIMSRTLIRASSDKSDPSKTIRDLNSQINQYGHGTNLACFYALLDPGNHTLEYVNAGFNPPFIVDPGGMVDTLGGGGIALGMLDKMELQETCIPIQQGDVMVMYSNGVVEADNGQKKQFGIERLINLVINNRNRPAREILMAVESELMDFSKAQPVPADVTLIILKRS